MARHHVIAVLVAVMAAAIGFAPAAAQFGTIFDPPRPPSEVPGRGPPRQAPPDYTPAQPPSAQPAPPAQAPPGAPSRAIQSQPLPPPPGVTSAPPPTQPQGAAPRPLGQPPALTGAPPGQRPPRGAPDNTAPQPGDEVITALPSQKVVNPTAVFSGLDKITGRIINFDVAINETVQFGALQVTPRACYTRPPNETPNTDAFAEVDEITLQGEVRRIFTGWMFASSPGLHAVEHPIYDVWLTDCKGDGTTVAGAKPPPPPAPAPAPPAPPPLRR